MNYSFQLAIKKDFKLDINKIDTDTIEDIESFLRNEHTLYNEYPEIYEKIPAVIGYDTQSTKASAQRQ